MNIETLVPRLQALKIVPVIALERAEDAVPLGAALRQSAFPPPKSPSAPPPPEKPSAACATPSRKCSSPPVPF